VIRGGSVGNPRRSWQIEGNGSCYRPTSVDLQWQSDGISILLQNDNGEAFLWHRMVPRYPAAAVSAIPGRAGMSKASATSTVTTYSTSGGRTIAAKSPSGSSTGPTSSALSVSAIRGRTGTPRDRRFQRRRPRRHPVAERQRRGRYLGNERDDSDRQRQPGEPGASWHVMSPGDYNHDGRADTCSRIVAVRSTSGR
jgi:hypothetical protein